MFKGRFPRVSFRAEIPFIFGLTCVFGMWTKMHHGLMLARKTAILIFSLFYIISMCICVIISIRPFF
jgi:hypothetical protein